MQPVDRSLLTAAEVAEYLRVPLTTLYVWRTRGTGPTASRVGRYLRYRRADLDEWLTAQTPRQGPPAGTAA